MCSLIEVEYEKVHSYKSSKDMWETLTLAYERTSQVKDARISILVYQYDLFKMEDHETIDQMFGRFQIIINNLRSLEKKYDNYDDHINQNFVKVTTLNTSKDLKKFPMEELLSTLKVHEIELIRMKAKEKASP
ncbi:hypothetical protein CR513_44120, partial [Mucuna pruriens]